MCSCLSVWTPNVLLFLFLWRPQLLQSYSKVRYRKVRISLYLFGETQLSHGRSCIDYFSYHPDRDYIKDEEFIQAHGSWGNGMMAGTLGLEQQVVAAWFPYISAADREVESLGWKQSWLLTPLPISTSSALHLLDRPQVQKILRFSNHQLETGSSNTCICGRH